MKRPYPWYVLPALSLLGCLHAPAPVPLPPAVNPIAVLPANNRTRDPLLVSGGTLVERYVLHSDRVTVMDVLAAEARRQLEIQGFTVVAPEAIEAAGEPQAPANAQAAVTLAEQQHWSGTVLYIDLRRWEPDIAFQPSAIIVWVDLTLLESSSGRVLWNVTQGPSPIATQGAINLGDAYVIAARVAMEKALAPLVPQTPTS